ncbi:hypothetical protein BDZ89DRAFT_1155361 [Hymenopellis radicata]|nr:hypothetical protein BDZ89DRAFT_1155361 [Hymenopellis radicata]
MSEQDTQNAITDETEQRADHKRKKLSDAEKKQMERDKTVNLHARRDTKAIDNARGTPGEPPEPPQEWDDTPGGPPEPPQEWDDSPAKPPAKSHCQSEGEEQQQDVHHDLKSSIFDPMDEEGGTPPAGWMRGRLNEDNDRYAAHRAARHNSTSPSPTPAHVAAAEMNRCVADEIERRQAKINEEAMRQVDEYKAELKAEMEKKIASQSEDMQASWQAMMAEEAQRKHAIELEEAERQREARHIARERAELAEKQSNLERQQQELVDSEAELNARAATLCTRVHLVIRSYKRAA